MRHRFTPSLPLAAFLLAALSAPILGCSAGATVGANGRALPAPGAVDAGVGASFQTGGQVGPGAKRCGPDGCPVPEAK
jgi:hypothetical protein